MSTVRAAQTACANSHLHPLCVDTPDASTLLRLVAQAGRQAVDWNLNPSTIDRAKRQTKLPALAAFMSTFQPSVFYISQTPVFSGLYTLGMNRYGPFYSDVNNTVQTSGNVDLNYSSFKNECYMEV